MITPPAGWVVERRQSGLIMVPPEGVDCGVICYQDDCRPLQRVAAIVASLPPPRGWRTSDLSEIERLVTLEGEQAALVTMRGSIDGAPGERTIGAVFTDAAYSLCVGLARRRDQFERVRDTVRGLVATDAFMLGTRRRRFVHAEPAGWHGFTAGPMHTTWVPVDYPRSAAVLTVFPALPVAVGEVGHAERFAREHATRLHADHIANLGTVSSARLSGQHWQVVAGAVVHDVVVLEDGAYIYPVALETFSDQRGEHVEVLWRLVRSIEPVPRSERVRPSMETDVFVHWRD